MTQTERKQALDDLSRRRRTLESELQEQKDTLVSGCLHVNDDGTDALAPGFGEGGWCTICGADTDCWSDRKWAEHESKITKEKR